MILADVQVSNHGAGNEVRILVRRLSRSGIGDQFWHCSSAAQALDALQTAIDRDVYHPESPF